MPKFVYRHQAAPEHEHNILLFWNIYPPLAFEYMT